jgi:hypothetical protein
LEGKVLKKMQGMTQQNIVRHTLHKQKKYSAERLSSIQVLSYASEIWPDQKATAQLIAHEASEIIQIVEKRQRVFFSGKSEKGILSGLFYLLGIKHKTNKTQREIVRSLGTNDVTLRSSYRNWLSTFPDFFQ